MNSASRGGALLTYVRRLHTKLKEDAGDPNYIVAVPSFGYRIGDSESPNQRQTPA